MQTADRPKPKAKTLTLTKIRELSNSCELEKCRQTLAESMTIEDSDEQELAALAAYKAVHRWAREHYDVAAPAEHLVEGLIFYISLSPLTAASVEGMAEEAIGHFDSRDEVLAALREEDALRSRQRPTRHCTQTSPPSDLSDAVN